MSRTVTNGRAVSVPSDEVNSRPGAEGRRLTVAELLAREGMTHEFPVVQEPLDDTPTDRIPVVELLRREGKWDRRKASKVGALAAGVVALAGIAATALSAGQLHDTAAAGGAGGPSIGPTTSEAQVPPQLVSTESSTPSGTVSKPGSAPVQQGSTSSQSNGSHSSSGTTQRAQTDAAAPTTEQQSSSDSPVSNQATQAPAPTTTTTTTREDSSSAAKPAPTTSQQPQSGGLLGAVGGTLGGLLGGILGH